MTTDTKLPRNAPVALLIGIEDYGSYDSTGKSNLLAGRNDVLAYWKVCRRLGYKPQHIVILTTPKLDPQWIIDAEIELGPELHRGQSAEDIRRLVKGWFLETDPFEQMRLDVATRRTITSYAEGLFASLMDLQNASGSPGFLAYSGHGARIDGQLALCPSDIDKNLVGAIRLQELGDCVRRAWGDANLKESALGRNLTIVLDCCFAADRPEAQDLTTQRLATLTPQKAAPGEPRPFEEIASRVFCASGPGEQSHQAMLGGYWYSAFTWAFTVALEQWKIREGHKPQSTISHNELLFRTRMLLEALSFRQHPRLVGKVGLSNEPVFGHYDQRGKLETSVEPNAERPDVQLDPNQSWYEIALLDAFSRTLGQWAIQMKDKNEHWFMPTSISDLSTANKIVISATASPPLHGDTAVWVLSCEVKWTPMTAAPSSDAIFFAAPDANGVVYGLELPKSPASSNKPTWYACVALGRTPGSLIVPKGESRGFARQMANSSDKTQWYRG